jgi:hypothetical protein
MSKVEILPLQFNINQFAARANCSTSLLWDVTNKKSPKFDPSAPPRIKRRGSTFFDVDECEEWLESFAPHRRNKRSSGSQ